MLNYIRNMVHTCCCMYQMASPGSPHFYHSHQTDREGFGVLLLVSVSPYSMFQRIPVGIPPPLGLILWHCPVRELYFLQGSFFTPRYTPLLRPWQLTPLLQTAIAVAPSKQPHIL